MRKVVSLIGQQFGRLLVLERAGSIQDGPRSTSVLWLCRCDCGNLLKVRGSYLKLGHTKSCGCLVKEGRPPEVDITGRKFGWLTAVERVMFHHPSGKKEGRWRCVCDCGKEVVIPHSRLLTGNTKSCGCKRGRPLKYGQGARNSILSRYKKNARTAKREWSLTEELFDCLTLGDCHYCGQAPTNVHSTYTSFGEFHYNGIDRKDSDLGYTPDNVVSCCKECQKAKSNTPYLQFVNFLRRAGKFQLQLSTVG
jgi:hypothetical protein